MKSCCSSSMGPSLAKSKNSKPRRSKHKFEQLSDPRILSANDLGLRRERFDAPLWSLTRPGCNATAGAQTLLSRWSIGMGSLGDHGWLTPVDSQRLGQYDGLVIKRYNIVVEDA